MRDKEDLNKDSKDLNSSSKEQLKSYIERERALAAQELAEIQRTTQHLFGTTQDAVKHPMNTLSDIVKPQRMLGEHPWKAAAAALAAGALIGFAATARKKRETIEVSSSPSYPRRPSMLDNLSAMVRREFSGVAENAVAMLVSKLKENLGMELRARQQSYGSSTAHLSQASSPDNNVVH